MDDFTEYIQSKSDYGSETVNHYKYDYICLFKTKYCVTVYSQGVS